MAADKIFEFRGVDNLVYAKVLVDTKEQFVTGEVKWLSPVAEIGKTTSSSSESKFYDNQPMIVISTVGADDLTLTIAPLDLPTYAEITGQTFDAGTGSLIEGESNPDYYAIGYRTKGTDGKYRYVWRYKGKFGIPDETNQTEDDGTETTNTQLTWTGVQTIHKFKKHGKSAKAIVCDERYGAVDFDTFFDEVKTPDNLVGTNIDGVANPFVYPDTSIFNTMLNVSIVCATPNAKIYYTTDGTEPNSTDGTQYTAPFIINDTTTIKAIAYADGKPTSGVTTKIYTRTN
jgi:phi13 family phage major tail protein